MSRIMRKSALCIGEKGTDELYSNRTSDEQKVNIKYLIFAFYIYTLVCRNTSSSELMLTLAIFDNK